MATTATSGRGGDPNWGPGTRSEGPITPASSKVNISSRSISIWSLALCVHFYDIFCYPRSARTHFYDIFCYPRSARTHFYDIFCYPRSARTHFYDIFCYPRSARTHFYDIFCYPKSAHTFLRHNLLQHLSGGPECVKIHGKCIRSALKRPKL